MAPILSAAGAIWPQSMPPSSGRLLPRDGAAEAQFPMIDSLFGPLARAAWPSRSVDRLLRAVLLRDQRTAAAEWREYESLADFDHLTPTEMGLIGLVSRRLGTLAPDSPMRPLIGGIERANWSRGQLAVGEAGTGLRALAAAGVAMLATGGAARLAEGGGSARGHLLNRMDVVLRPDDMEKAFDLLIEDGWQPAGPGTAVYQRARLADLAGLDFVRGQFGRIGIHRTPFHTPHASAAEEAPVWQRSLVGRLAEAPVRFPSAADAVAMALVAGLCEGEGGADRLIDLALAIDAGVNWELLLSHAERRRLQALTAAALRYARDRLERPVPGSVLRRLELGAMRRPLALFATLTKPRRKSAAVRSFRLALAAAGKGRYFGPRRRVVFPSPFWHGARTSVGTGALEQDLPLPGRGVGSAWSGIIDLGISVELSPVSRRLDFEVNSSAGHHLRLTALVRDKGQRRRLLRFRFPIALAPQDGGLVLVAAASRGIAPDAPQSMMERYGARPFTLVRLHVVETALR